MAVDRREHLTILNAVNNNLTGSIPNGLGNITGLQTLSLNNNSLTGPMPEELTNLTNLVALNLYGNQLSGPIPENIGLLEFDALRDLYLSTDGDNWTDTTGWPSVAEFASLTWVPHAEFTSWHEEPTDKK